MQVDKVRFDVMLDGAFICTMVMPIDFTKVSRYIGDVPVVNKEMMMAYVEKKRPTLAGKNYNMRIW